jgi:PAS domain S-box-containing protein
MAEKPTYEALAEECAKLNKQLVENKKEFIELGLFREIVERSNEAVAVSDADGKLIYINPAHEKLFGYSLKEAQKKNYRDYYPPKSVEILENTVVPVLESCHTWEGVLHAYDAEGRLFPLWERADSVCDDEGNMQFAFGMMHDVTEEWDTKEALSREKEKAQRYLDIAAVIIVVINAEGEILLINKKGCEVLGYKEEQIVGKNWFDTFLPERLRVKVKKVSSQLLAGEIEPLEYYENPVLTKNSHERIIAWHNSVIRDAVGNIVGHISSGTDITEQKQAEEALISSEEKFRQLFNAVTDAVTLFDANTNQFVDVNKAATELYGYTKEMFLNLKYKDITAKPESSDITIRQTLDGTFTKIPVRYHKKMDGTIFPAEISAGAFQIEDRTLLCGVVRDITKRKKAEEALRKAHDALESQVEERTLQLREAKERLEKVNTGLQVLIEHRQEEIKRLQKNIIENVNKLIMPYLEKLDKGKMGARNEAYLEIVIEGLKELLSPFASTLSSKEVILSPTEIRVADLIRLGKTSKEIAALMHVSVNAITVHRYNMRRKLGLLNKKVNLRSYLQSLTAE